MDVRQLMAGALTFSMFIMLGNMIKRDHFDSATVLNVPASSSQYDAFKVSRQSLVELTGVSKVHPRKEPGEPLKPCWNMRSLKGSEASKGFITFSLSGDPEYHVSQVADAVVVARFLGATLVLPDIIRNKPGETRNFAEIYDAEKFVRSLNGVIQVATKKPPEVSSGNLVVVRVPNGVSEDYIARNVEPFFRRKRILKIATYFPTINTRKAEENKFMNSFSCLAMFQALHLKPALQEVVNSMVGRLKTLTGKSNGQFIAVDLRVDMFVKGECQEMETNGIKNCYNALEISKFLKKIGTQRETAIYLTQPVWHSSLDALKEAFPNTYTKHDLMEDDVKKKFLISSTSDFGKAVDFHICSVSDVFVPASSGLFYTNVVGERIASSKMQVLVPAQISSTSPRDYISSYISKKNHLAYTCFCEFPRAFMLY